MAPLLPLPRPRPKGGRPPIENCAALTGILFVRHDSLEMAPTLDAIPPLSTGRRG